MGLVIDSSQAQAAPGRFAGVIGRPLMNSELGAKSVSMSVLTLEPGAVLPLHVHVDEESFFVLDGQGVATVGEEQHAIGPAIALLAAGGETHGFANNTDKPLRILCMHPVGQPQTRFLESE